MEPYGNLIGDSGVLAFKLGDDCIEIQFKGKSGKYRYTARVIGVENLEVMDFTGKPMKGYVFVDPPGLERDRDVSDWAERCHGFVQSLPPKKAK